MADAIDEFTLLCESCGYPLTGLPTAGNCPECGSSIAASLPELRVGSVWQQRPRPATWWSTNRTSLFRPGKLFETLRVDGRRNRGLLALNLVAASACIAGSVIPPFLDERLVPGSGRRDADITIPMLVMVIVIFTAAVALVLALLTVIEVIGVRVWGRRSQSRITPAVASAVCAHASVGWVVAGLGWLIGFLFLWLLKRANVAHELPRWLRFAVAAPPFLSLLAGLLIFEILTYTGIRRCRFANRMPPAPDA